jgi:hypothetical protein
MKNYGFDVLFNYTHILYIFLLFINNLFLTSNT